MCLPHVPWIAKKLIGRTGTVKFFARDVVVQTGATVIGESQLIDFRMAPFDVPCWPGDQTHAVKSGVFQTVECGIDPQYT